MLALRAKGVQIYECRASGDPRAPYAWKLQGPEAKLFDAAGHQVGKHYAGPTWESNDGSKVVGEVRAQDAGPDSTAVAWLLLTAKSTSGSGVFGKVQSIQRVRTSGGQAPAGPCGIGQAHRALRVPYTASYYFYAADS